MPKESEPINHKAESPKETPKKVNRRVPTAAIIAGIATFGIPMGTAILGESGHLPSGVQEWYDEASWNMKGKLQELINLLGLEETFQKMEEWSNTIPERIPEVKKEISFTSKEYGFTVNFPKYPIEQKVPKQKINGISYSVIQYLSTPDNDTAYVVQVATTDISPQRYNNEIGLKRILETLPDATLIDSTFTKFQGYDAVNFSLTTKEGHFVNAIAFIKDDLAKIKIFGLSLLTKSNNSSDFNNFIDSFKLE